jgi:hypothetical protein
MRDKAKDKLCCLVLDNLETTFSNEKLMAELGEILVLLDGARFANIASSLFSLACLAVCASTSLECKTARRLPIA